MQGCGGQQGRVDQRTAGQQQLDTVQTAPCTGITQGGAVVYALGINLGGRCYDMYIQVMYLQTLMSNSQLQPLKLQAKDVIKMAVITI